MIKNYLEHCSFRNIPTKQFFLIVLIIFSSSFQSKGITYLTEDFESSWTGNPQAPSGWTQSRVALIGDGQPEQITTNGEKDWEQNTWNGTDWTKSIPSGTNPASAQSGTGVLWMNNIFFGPTASSYGSRRVESPVMNLSSATSPFVRFYLHYLLESTVNNLRIMASSDGGTTWNSIMIIPANSLTGVAGWEQINVKIPVAYRTANCKIGIEMSNNFSTQNIWIDNLVVEDFSPATINSATSGNWNDPATWVGGVVPRSVDDVHIVNGQSVVVNANIARCQNLSVSGTLSYSTTTTHLLHIFGNLSINVGGAFNAFNATSGRRVYLGGNFTNAGTANFDVGTGVAFVATGVGTLFWVGGEPATFTNTGTITNGRIPHIYHANSGGVTYMNAVSISRYVGLHNGVVNPNGMLTVGVSPVTSHGVEICRGLFSSAPIWGSGIITRNYSFSDGNLFSISGNFTPCGQIIYTLGEEVETISAVRTITGSLSFNTHSNVQLNYPMTLGTSTTGSLTMNRGILITSFSNLLTLAPFVSGSTGTDASILSPPVNHGSFIYGPLRINFPSSGTTNRNFPIGIGSHFNNTTPTPNLKRTITLQTTTAWASQTITASVELQPSGAVNPPLTTVIGYRCYRLNRNGGPDLPSTARITIPGTVYAFGNSDHLVGNEDELRVSQSTSITGPWTERSVSSGLSSSLTPNVHYTRTSSTSSPGPISLLASKGEYFAWGAAPPPPPPCNTSNATSCLCEDSVSTNCDLLPDIKIARAPLLVSGTSGVIEYPQDNSPDTANNGRLRISVSTPNIGAGPLEIRAQNIFTCHEDTFPGPAPALCPDGHEPHQLITQRVYHKNGNTMSYYDREAGAMSYHASHGHMHVDNWGAFTLRKSNGDPNPLNWPVYGDGAKIAFCLMDYGSCSTYDGHCVNDGDTVLTNGNFPNFGLGGGTYSCSAVMQGISSGYTDIYYQSLDGMWIDIPPGTCNGDYYIVSHIDPDNYFLEENEDNNVMAVPYTLTKQSGSVPVITATGPTEFCPGGSVTLTSSPAASYLWSNGSTTQSIVVTNPDDYYVITEPSSLCPGSSDTIAVSHVSLDITPTSPEICPGDSVQLQASGSGSTTNLFVLGTGTIVNGAQAYPAPYGNYYWGAKHQFLILASELSASGMTAGQLDELSFDVTTPNSSPVVSGFNIKIGNTGLSAITTWQSGLSTVLSALNHQPVVGWNTHTFNTPYIWDGISNLIVEVCFQNASWLSNGNASVRQSTTGFSSTVYYRADNNLVCGSASVTAAISQRPNMRFGRSNTIAYSWTPVTGLDNPSSPNPFAFPAVTTNYTVSINNTCNSSNQVNVIVNNCDTTSASISINAFIQGYYRGNGMMVAVIDSVNFPAISDTLTLSLASAIAPYNITNTVKGVLHTDGSCTFNLPVASTGISRYIILKHRNSLETWSAVPVTIYGSTNYDFSDSASAYAGSSLVQVESGKYALWSGDISSSGTPGLQDGVIDMNDMQELEIRLTNLENGYSIGDLTGDKLTEAADQSLMENNLQYFLLVIKPQ
ncbi:MAG: hypothetical protein KA444_04670 [Bacteroidia bacterium]|nr:hypothetical protein [Bacteroidia bacterium]